MAQKISKEKKQEKEEQLLAREQRRELREELDASFAERPRMPKNRQRILTFSILGVLALLVLGFGILVLLPTPTQQPVGGIGIGAKAPDFTLPILGGPGSGNIKLSALRGHPVVINFWSESCLPCLSEVPYLRQVYEPYSKQGTFTLLGINQSDPREDIKVFGHNYNVNYPLLYDAGSNVNVAYNVTSLPQTYFIDSEGIVRYVVPQQLTAQEMQKGLDAVGIHLT